MNSFLYILAGFAIGFEVGRFTTGKKCDWKRALFTGLIAFLIAIAVVILKL